MVWIWPYSKDVLPNLRTAPAPNNLQLYSPEILFNDDLQVPAIHSHSWSRYILDVCLRLDQNVDVHNWIWKNYSKHSSVLEASYQLHRLSYGKRTTLPDIAFVHEPFSTSHAKEWKRSQDNMLQNVYERKTFHDCSRVRLRKPGGAIVIHTLFNCLRAAQTKDKWSVLMRSKVENLS